MRHGRALATAVMATSVAVGVLVLAAPLGAQTVDQAEITRLQNLIEQQQRQIEAQSQLLGQLQRQVQQLSQTAAQASATAAQASTAATQAAAAAEQASQKVAEAEAPEKMVTSGNKGIKLAISGQVNRGVLFVDDGHDGHVFHVDNDNSSTRVRFVGKGNVSDDFSVGAQVEVQFESNSTAAINQFSDRGVGPNNFTERKLEFYLDSKRFGRLWVGQGDTASNGTSEVDLSGTGVIGYSAVDVLAGGLIFSRGGAQPVISDLTVGGAFSNLDGLSRDDRVRYDTPSFAGFKLSTSAIADGRWDIAGRYSGEIAGTKLAAAVSYWDRPTRQGVSGSVSARHASGLNLTFAAGNQDFDAVGRKDSNFWYVKGGYLDDFLTALGKTGIAIDYFSGQDQSANEDEGQSYGAFLVQNVDRIGTEFYLGGRVYDVDRPGVDYDDIIAVLGGARVKF